MSLTDYFAWRASSKEEPRTASLAEQLKAAQVEVDEARRVKQIADAVQEDWRKKMKSIRRDLSDVERFKLPEMRSQFEEKNRAAAEAETTLNEKQSVFAGLQAELHKNPIYQEALAGQRKIIDSGAGLADKSWSVPLFEIAAVRRQLEALADDEQHHVSTANAKLRAAGLPEIKARLRGLIPNITPDAVLDLPLAAHRVQAIRYIATLKS